MRFYYNTDFNKMTPEEIKKWVMSYKHQLVGSAVFVKGENFISKMVSFVCKGKDDGDGFVPSHIGSLVQLGGNVYIFDMVPPKAKLTKLEDFIAKNKDEFIIAIRDFELNTEEFSYFLCEKVNDRYGYISAIQSAFKFLWYPIREHCSELHLLALQNQGLFKTYCANETTPEDLFAILKGGKY